MRPREIRLQSSKAVFEVGFQFEFVQKVKICLFKKKLFTLRTSARAAWAEQISMGWGPSSSAAGAAAGGSDAVALVRLQRVHVRRSVRP